MPISEDSADTRGEMFSRLLMEERRRILGFIHALVQDRAAADERRAGM